LGGNQFEDLLVDGLVCAIDFAITGNDLGCQISVGVFERSEGVCETVLDTTTDT
jgi:hypothetical protein